MWFKLWANYLKMAFKCVVKGCKTGVYCVKSGNYIDLIKQIVQFDSYTYVYVICRVSIYSGQEVVA